MGKDVIISEIGEVTELLYQQKTTEGYDKLNKLIQDLSVYITTITDPEQQQSLLEALKEALSAMQENDTTMLADILQYELAEKL
ncbi:MAG: hypothetical protein K5656_11510 [Lachnospiraceae bacterium]|nr:hypothetical protein [Lachnospiraceae bacterium]